MMEYQKRRDTLGKYEPAKYDKRVEFTPPYYYTAILDVDSSHHVYYRGVSFVEAQKALEHLPLDIYEGPDVPFSVFYPRRA